MAAWATPKQAPKPQMRAIIAEEREVAGDDELREALAASRREADQLAARIVDAETAEPAATTAPTHENTDNLHIMRLVDLNAENQKLERSYATKSRRSP